MDINQQKEHFSKAWIKAIASTAGMATAEPGPDHDSIDWTVYSREVDGYLRSPKLDIQVKCTSNPDTNEGVIRFPLPVKNYNDLRGYTADQRILVVVIVPNNPRDWLDQNPERLAMLHCAYWVSLRGKPDTDNDNTVTVHVPMSQVFSVDALCDMMRRIGGGGTP